MRLTLSLHAKGIIEKRGIDLAWIEETVITPDRIELDTADPTVTRAYRRIDDFGGRVLRAVYRRQNEDILIITAFFDRGARL